MPAPEFLIHAAEGWSRYHGTHKAVATGLTFIHLAGLLLGGGAAVAADRQTLKAAREADAIRADHLRFLASVHGVALAGLALLALSGVAMLFADLETFWDTRAFWVKMGLVALLLANATVMGRAEKLALRLPASAWARLKVTSIVSLVLWFAVVLAGTILASS